MGALMTLVGSPGLATLSQTLLHFLWQGLALALLAGAGLAALRRASANARYVFLLAVLLLMLLAPAVTFALLHHAPPEASPATFVGAPSPVALPASVPPSAAVGAAVALPPLAQARLWLLLHLNWLAALWAAGVCLLSLRLLLGWLGLTSLRRRAVVLEAWRERVEQLAARVGVRRPVLPMESARLHAPAVLGWLRPAILLPSAVLTGLTPAQLELVLAHELAHVRRHDYLVNVLQSLAETLLFYHPAVWWLSRRVRLERECCCDDLAIAVCADRAAYAHALTALGQVCSGAVGLAPAASGSDLGRRVRRILRAPAPRTGRPPWVAGVVALGLVAAVGVGVQAARPAAAKAKVKPTARATKGKLDLTEVQREEARLREALAKATRERDDVRRRMREIKRRREQMLLRAARAKPATRGETQVVNLGPQGAALEQEEQALAAQHAALEAEQSRLLVRLQELTRIRLQAKTQAEVEQRLQTVRAKEQADLAEQKAQLGARLATLRAKQEASRAEQASLEQRLKEIEAEQQEAVGKQTATSAGVGAEPGEQPKGLDQQAAAPATAHAEAVISRMAKLEFIEPQYLLYLLGLSDDPGPREYQTGETAMLGAEKPAPSMDLGGAGKGSLPDFLPEGVTVTAFPLLHSLLLHGTESQVGKFVEFLRLIDRRPQQVLFDIKVYPALPEGLGPFPPGFVRPGELQSLPGPPRGEKEYRFGKTQPIDAIRVATFNLVTAVNEVRANYHPGGGETSMRLEVTPRVESDRTLMVWMDLELTGMTSGPAGEATHAQKLKVTLSVNQGDRMAFAFRRGEKVYTLVISGTVLAG